MDHLFHIHLQNQTRGWRIRWSYGLYIAKPTSIGWQFPVCCCLTYGFLYSLSLTWVTFMKMSLGNHMIKSPSSCRSILQHKQHYQLLVSYHSSAIALRQWKQFLPPEEFKPTWQRSGTMAYNDGDPRAPRKALFSLGIKYFRIFWIYCSSAFSMKDFYLATKQYSFWESTCSSQLSYSAVMCSVVDVTPPSIHFLPHLVFLSPRTTSCAPMVLATLLRATVCNTVRIGRINKVSKNSLRFFEGVSPYIL